MKTAATAAIAFFLVVLTIPGIALAEITGIEITERVPLLGGQDFGGAGPYEKLSGTIHFAFDPANPANARIVDLDLAPTVDGRVTAQANFTVLRPIRSAESVAFLEVSNRGGKASMPYFNRSQVRSLDPTTAEELGDGFLMRQGLTVIWVGWQFDVPPREGLLRLEAPIATEDGRPITGLVRCDWTVDAPSPELDLGHRGHIPYPVADTKSAIHRLTVRNGRLAQRREIPRENWDFSGDLNQRIRLEGGFDSGKIYELVYLAKNPAIVGLGLAAIRDMISYAKYDTSCPFPVKKAMGFGVSQTGRFLRHFLYQGFNVDEQGRQAFDGLIIHTAGAGRGSFNHRFAQPSRDAHRYSAFFYPTDIFPFSSRVQLDMASGNRDGLFRVLSNDGKLPKVFFTNSGYEYWGRTASLIHTSIEGSTDVELFENERIYHFSSSQHFVPSFPPKERSARSNPDRFLENYVNFKVALRALTRAMKLWVKDDQQPPDSRYPRIDDGTLVPIDAVDFPAIPGIEVPGVIHEAYRADYGPRWDQGVVDHQPPRLGKAFPALVSQVDRFGNEMAGVRMVEVRVPLATFYPWTLRHEHAGGVGEIVDFWGTTIPLPTSDGDSPGQEDPRPSISELYETKAEYLARIRKAIADLVGERFLLEEDAAYVEHRASEQWDRIHR